MDIYIKDGKIEKIAKSIKSCKTLLDNGKEIEFSDKNLHVSTGWMDIHSNFREPGFEHKDDLKTGINSAITGGFTSVLLMPNTKPIIDSKSHVEYIRNNTKGNIIDIHTSSSITKNMEGND